MPVGQFFFSWTQDRQELTITSADIKHLRNAPLMLDHDPVFFSKQLWSYLNLALGQQGEQRVVFNNVDSLNGLEAWRRIVAPLGSRTLAHQHSLYTPVHQPGRAKIMKGAVQAYDIWDRNMRDYQAAGGQAPPEATKCVIVGKCSR